MDTLLVIAIDLEMGGCGEWSWADRVRLCLEAGHQSLLVCQTDEGIGACAEALAELPESCWVPARARFLSLRKNLLPPPRDGFDPGVWTLWLEEIQREAAASQE